MNDAQGQAVMDFSPATRTSHPETSLIAEKQITESGKRLSHCRIILNALMDYLLKAAATQPDKVIAPMIECLNEIEQLQDEIESLNAGYRLNQERNDGLQVELYKFRSENDKYKTALMEIITESGKVNISNWPAQQQICQSIAQQALMEK